MSSKFFWRLSNNIRSLQVHRFTVQSQQRSYLDARSCVTQPQILKPNLAVGIICHRFVHLSHCDFKSKKTKAGPASKIKQLVSPNDVEEFIDLNNVKSELECIVKNLQSDLAQNFRIGTDLTVFEQLEVTVEDEVVALSDIGQIAKVNPRLVTIDLVAFPEWIPQVQKALQNSSINCNVMVAGSIIKVHVAQGTAEYRRDLSKRLKVRVGECKSDLHNVATKETNHMFSIENVSIDTKKLVGEQLKLYAQHYVAQVEEIGKAKAVALFD